MNELEKPFWLSPPYVILFDLIRLYKIRPWDVDIAPVLMAFLKEMRGKGVIDFSASGTALLSSAIIHRLKSDSLLKMEAPPKKPEPKPFEEVLPPLPMPLRFEYTSTSITEVIQSLISSLELEQKVLAGRRPAIFEVPFKPELDDFFLNIEERLEEFFNLLKERASGESSNISFFSINEGLPLLQIVRNFILLLFLVHERRVSIDQQSESDDILITV
ncbi:hypothetical protein [[Eubacterium] cellulosolvens]